MENKFKKKILIIDDEESIRMMLTQALELGGYTVEVAEDGKVGVEKFLKDRSFSLILTDMMMPKMNGIEVLEQVRVIDPDIEVVVLTGYGGHSNAIEAMKKGAYDYLEKPTNIEELFIVMEKALERRRLSYENKEYQRNLEKLVEIRTSELNDTKNFLQSVLDSSSDHSIIATDLDGIITLFNKGSENLLGYDANEVESRETVMLFTPEDQKGEFRKEQPKVKNDEKTILEREKIVRRKDGRLVTVSLSVAQLTDKNNNVIGTLGIAKDITRQKKLERKLKQYTENLELLVAERTAQLANRNIELEATLEELHEAQAQVVQSEKMASIGQLSAGVAHEINNPIGFVHSNMSTLKKYAKRIENVLAEINKCIKGENELSSEVLEGIIKKGKIDFILTDLQNIIDESMDGTRRVKTIVKDLKNFSNIDKSQIVTVDITDGIESTLNIVWNEIKYKAEVVKEFSEIPAISCNIQKLNQVFLNMLVNASHAIEETLGKIVIRTFDLDDGRIAIEIEDNGKGMDQETVKKIFDPFFTTKEIGQGTGLGLSVSYRIIKEHGGDIEVESEVGIGTKFRIILPLVLAEVD
jgi:PAS domain S-box-containing protein